MKQIIKKILIATILAAAVPTAFAFQEKEERVALRQVESTNLVHNPIFAQGMMNWGAVRTGTSMVRALNNDEGYYPANYAHVQMVNDSATSIARLTYQRTVPIDLSKSYKYGLTAKYDSAADGATLGLIPLSPGKHVLRNLAVKITPSTTWTESCVTINAAGRAVPAWPSGTSGANLFMERNGSVNKWHVTGIYFVREEQMPHTLAPREGTHEAVADSANDLLYVISHRANQVTKMNLSALVRQAAPLTVSDEPHGIILAAGYLWVVTEAGQQLIKIDSRKMTVAATYKITGPRDGFWLTFDGTHIWISAGDANKGQTPAIIRFNPANGLMDTISTDVNFGSANGGLADLAGSIWSIKMVNRGNDLLANSDIKRINKTSGATEATINGRIGRIYGLGTDGSYLYANGTKGVAKVDPRRNAVVATYLFKKLRVGETNLKYENGRIWGGAQGVPGIFYLDINAGELHEIDADAMYPKWVAPSGRGEVVSGDFQMPVLSRYRRIH